MIERVRKRLPRELRFRTNRFILDTPVLGETYLLLRGPLRPFRVTKDTEIVIEGFPRSANTYALHVFGLATADRVHISGHTHASRTVVQAVRRQLPCIVLAREPGAAVASLLQMAPGVRALSALRGYQQFHTRLLPYLPAVQVAKFETVVSDFGAVMKSCNAQFGTAFPEYQHTSENESVIRQRIDEASFRRSGYLAESGVARPSQHRQNPEEMLLGLDREARAAYSEATEIYHRFIEGVA